MRTGGRPPLWLVGLGTREKGPRRNRFSSVKSPVGQGCRKSRSGKWVPGRVGKEVAPGQSKTDVTLSGPPSEPDSRTHQVDGSVSLPLPPETASDVLTCSRVLTVVGPIFVRDFSGTSSSSTTLRPRTGRPYVCRRAPTVVGCVDGYPGDSVPVCGPAVR